MAYSIYIHKNKINGKVYIGQTKLNPKYRWKNGEGYKSCAIMNNAIAKYGWESFEHFVLFDNLNLDEANEKEKEMITEYKSNDIRYGYNIREGGNNSRLSDLTKRKIGESMRGEKHHQFGKPRTEEVREKIVKAKSKAVNMMDSNGNLIAEYENARQACEHLGFKDHTCISKACTGKRKKAHGFKWEYKKI